MTASTIATLTACMTGLGVALLFVLTVALTAYCVRMLSGPAGWVAVRPVLWVAEEHHLADGTIVRRVYPYRVAS